MLATLADRVPSGDWVYERKLDGYRILARCTPEGARLSSRNGNDVTERFPLTDGLPRRYCLLDGEAVAFRDGGRESFTQVQRGAATHLVFFDILQLDQEDVRHLPWRERRALLDDLTFGGRTARLPWTRGEGRHLHGRACAAGWEGLIAKDPESRYRAGRSPSWLKLKCLKGQEFVIGGFTDPAGAREGIGALLVGYHGDDGLQYAGKVGTGFDRATLASLRQRLDMLERSDAPFADTPPMKAHWVDPVLVCRVDFTEWTDDDRLRHPRFLGLRDDKAPLEVVREA